MARKKNGIVLPTERIKDGGVQFVYLSVVQELYEPFIKKYRTPQQDYQFFINPIPIRSRTDDVLRAFERYESPIIVEAPVVTAANILAADEKLFRFIGTTYLILPSSHKCGLYYNVQEPEKVKPASGGGVQLLLHTGKESIATIMAETYALENEWGVDFEEPGKKIDVGDYKAVYEYIENLPAEWPSIPIAFTLSGKLHNLFLKEHRNRFFGVEDLTSHFFDIISEISDDYQGLGKGIPGTILLTRTVDLTQYNPTIQRFVDVWYEHLENMEKAARLKYLNEWRFAPVPWTNPSYLRNAILFTDFVLRRFKGKKLPKMRPLPIACYEPLWPSKLKDEQRKKAQRTLMELHQEFAGRSVERLALIHVTGGRRVEDLKERAYKAVKDIANISDGQEAEDLGKNLQKIAELHMELDWLVDSCIEQRQEETCTSCAGTCFYGLARNHKIVFQILVWKALFAKHYKNVEEAYITQDKLLSGELAVCYRELVEGLTLGDKGFLRKSIKKIREVLGDNAERQIFLETVEHEDDTPTDYYLTIATNERVWSGFSCRIADAFDNLRKASRFWSKGYPDEVDSYIEKAGEHKVIIPAGVLIRFGLEHFLPKEVQ